MPINEISDHSKIITLFKNGVTVSNLSKDNYNWNALQHKFKWDNNKKKQFMEELQNSINEIEDISQRIDAGLISSTGEKIQKLFIDAAHNTFGKKRSNSRKNWKKRKKSKKWFDEECEAMKREVRKAGKEKFLNPNVNLLKTKYHEKLKEYKRKCKSKRYNFWQSNFNDIENSLGDSKTFWRKWKNASEHYSNTKVPDITGQQWYDHFSKLHTETREGNDLNFRREGVDKVYQDLGINEPFTEKEFTSVIKNLKNCKAAGFDGLPNEILKNSPKVIHLLLLKFINLCLTKCLIPQSWCKELINPIFKDGLLNDPNNYRGICISSALLKIICSLLNNRVHHTAIV